MLRLPQAAAWMLLPAVILFSASCGFKRKKYENPITKDTQQPDKILFDKSISDIEHGRYETARLTLNTLINTYDTSEYLAKAKLAVADSWYREGGAHGLAQAEAEYKDFILFYPTMPEAAESQERICMIHYKQMEKADRDPSNALQAEQDCRQLMIQFPNSKYAPIAEQRLREIQEVLADAEMRAGDFYHHKGSNAAAANRLGALVDQYPLYSHADLALWEEADSYSHMGPRFRQRSGEALARIVRDYPLSPYAILAKQKLESLELAVPEPDPAAVARMKFEMENRVKPGLLQRNLDFLRRSPDVSSAAKSGTPTMTNPRASIPASVPAPAGSAGFSGDVTVAPIAGSSALDTNPDARSNPPSSSRAGESPAKPESATKPESSPQSASQPSPSAADSNSKTPTDPQPVADLKDKKSKKKKKAAKDDKTKGTTAATPVTAQPATQNP